MNIIMWILVIYLLIIIIRVLKGPTIWDRFLGFSIISSKVVVLMITYSAINGTGYLLDLAIIYALFGILGEIFIILFLSNRLRDGKENDEHY